MHQSQIHMADKITHITPDRIALGCSIWYTICILRTIGHATCSIAIYQFLSLLCAYICIRQLPYKNPIYAIITVAGTIQAIYAITQSIGITHSNHLFFDVTGFMGNPGQLGGFQSVAFVSTIIMLHNSISKHNSQKFLLYCSAVLIAYSLFLSQSRASFLAILVGSGIIYWKWLKVHLHKSKWLWFILIQALLILVATMYYLRTSSVEARMLIWRVSADMIADKPLFGFGAYGFNMHYMLYQAEYFKNHPDSIFTLVADNATYPYNELIHITIEQGIIGLSLFLMLLYSIVTHTPDFRKVAPLMTLLIFSLFSYPSYKHSLAMLFPILTASLIPCDSTPKNKKYNIVVSINSAILCILFTLLMFSTQKSYIKNTKIISEDSLQNIFPSCENWCAIGCFHVEKNQFNMAEAYLCQAAQMIPTRLCPNYQLWKLYVKQGDLMKAKKIGRKILTQPLKVENTYTLKAKAEIKEWLQIHDNAYRN